MNDYQLTPDDPRLTAYALGELEGDERAAVEAALRRDPALRAALEEIRHATTQLEAALADEPMPTAASRPPMAAAAAAQAEARELRDDPYARRSILRWPQFYYIVGLAAAACFAIVLALRTPPPTPTANARRAPQEKIAQPVALAPADTLAPAATPAPSVTVTLPASPPASATPEPAIFGGRADANAPAAVVTSNAVAVTSPTPAPPATVEPAAPTVPSDGRLQLANPSSERVALRDLAATSPAAAASVTASVQPAAIGGEGAARTFTHPADERAVTTPSPTALTADSKAVVAAEQAIAFAGDDKALVRAEPTQPVAVVAGVVAGTAKTPAPTSILPPSSAAMTFSSRSPSNVTAGTGTVATNNTITLSQISTATSNALVESAREALMRPLAVTSPGGASAGAASVRGDSFISAAQMPVSAFTIESETSSWPTIRRFLQGKHLPPRETVRIEELVNYFPYHYAPPQGDAPFAASLEVADAPWAPAHRLVRIGLKAREVAAAPRAPMNLVFVLDVVDIDRLASRLPMIKDAIRSLVRKLHPEDRVALVNCHDDGSLVLAPTPVAKTAEILDALDRVTATGNSTNRMKGIQLGYAMLQSGGTGRVILCTDGNNGITITAEGALARYLEGKARSGVALTAVAFGMGIYHDSLIDFLAEYGTGNYGYIDSRRDAEKFLAEDVNGAAVTIAKDVKIEVEFNPARVASYRLIGYENRELGRDDFKTGSFAADEVSAGHAVTALFEIVPADGKAAAAPASAEGLRYQPPKIPAVNLPAPDPNELLTVKVRYKKPGGAIARKLDLPLADRRTRFVDASADFKFAAAVATFGMVLRDSPYRGGATLANVIEWAESATADDPEGYRGEFVELAREAERLAR